jgi:hypothetical protein
LGFKRASDWPGHRPSTACFPASNV